MKSMAKQKRGQSSAAIDDLVGGRIRGRRIMLGLTGLGQPDGISPSRMAEMLEVDKAGPKVRC
jgi:hypothetical protein